MASLSSEPSSAPPAQDLPAGRALCAVFSAPSIGRMSADSSLSFVLLPQHRMPSVEDFQRAWVELTKGAKPPTIDSWGATTAGMELDGVSTMIGLMPTPVPGGEAEQAAALSVCALASGGYQPAPHVAHLTVFSRTFSGAASMKPAARLLRHTRAVAALVEAASAIAVYDGSGQATHSAEFFLEVVRGMQMPVMVWTGLSVATTTSSVEFLTLGLQQLQLPELLLSAPRGQADEALPFLFELVDYMAERGCKIEVGQTVGRSATEKYVVAYVPSPLDPAKRVMRVDMTRKA